MNPLEIESQGTIAFLGKLNTEFSDYTKAIQDNNPDIMNNKKFGRGANAAWFCFYWIGKFKDGGHISVYQELEPMGKNGSIHKVVDHYTRIPAGVNPEEWKKAALSSFPGPTGQAGMPWFITATSISNEYKNMSLKVILTGSDRPNETVMEVTAAKAFMGTDEKESKLNGFNVVNDFMNSDVIAKLRTAGEGGTKLFMARNGKIDAEATAALEKAAATPTPTQVPAPAPAPVIPEKEASNTPKTVEKMKHDAEGTASALDKVKSIVGSAKMRMASQVLKAIGIED